MKRPKIATELEGEDQRVQSHVRGINKIPIRGQIQFFHFDRKREWVSVRKQTVSGSATNDKWEKVMRTPSCY